MFARKRSRSLHDAVWWPRSRSFGLLQIVLVLGTGLVFLSAASGLARAQPANDTFANAIALSGPAGSIAGSNVSATGEAGEPSTGFNLVLNSVWYRWVAAASGPATFETCGGISDYDTHLAVFVGTAVNALAVETFNDDACSLQSRVTFNATIGTTYYIQVDGFSTAQGNFTLTYPAGAVPVSAPTQVQTTQAIARFLKRRNDRLLAAAPDSVRQIARLRAAGEDGRADSRPSGVVGNVREVEGGNASKPLAGGKGTGRTAFSAQTGRTIDRLDYVADGVASLSVATSLSQARQDAAVAERRRLKKLLGPSKYSALGAGSFISQYSRPPDFDIWIEGRYANFDNGSSGAEGSGHFGVVYVGADYVVNASLLFGMLLQVDHTTETSRADTTDIDGNGWMIGPYVTARLARNIYFQGRFAWGHSENDITVATAHGRFDTRRWLVRGKLQGDWRQGAWQFAPSLSVAHIRERQKGYVDTSGTTIPGQTVSLGHVSFGPEVSYTMRPSDGTVWVPRAAFRGVWSFSEDIDTAAASAISASETLRGQAELGLSVVGANGSSLDFMAAYDGVGDRDFSAYSGSMRLRLRY